MTYDDKYPRFPVQIDGNDLTFTCPRCLQKITHGAGGVHVGPIYGHRVSHCRCWKGGYYLVRHDEPMYLPTKCEEGLPCPGCERPLQSTNDIIRCGECGSLHCAGDLSDGALVKCDVCHDAIICQSCTFKTTKKTCGLCAFKIRRDERVRRARQFEGS